MAADPEKSLTAHSAHKTAPRWTFTGLPQPKSRGKESPGPGEYSALSTEKDKFRTAQKYTIVGASPDGKIDGPPGPNRYKPNDGHRLSAARWGFGSEPRLHEAKRDVTPGPGRYDTARGLEGRRSSLSWRPDRSAPSLNPAPDKYNPDMSPVWKTAPKSSFGASNNADFVLHRTPGPGSYTIDPSTGKRAPPRYTIQGKRSVPKPVPTPGPISSLSMFKK